METETKEVLSRFQEFFDNNGYTQKTFAESYGVKPSYISAIFVGRRGISAGLMKTFINKGEGPALNYIISGQSDELEKLKQELRDCRMLVNSLEGIITKSMKGG